MKLEKNQTLKEPSSTLKRKSKNKSSRIGLYSQDKRYEVIYIDIDRLKPFKNQSRKIFNEEDITGLAETIREHGIRNPLTVIISKDDTFEIVSGERRYRAAKQIGLKNIPCIIVDNEKEAEEIALIENIQRKDLSPIELGRSFKKLIEQNIFKTQEDLANRLGIQRSKVVECLGYLKIPTETQEYLLEKNIIDRSTLRKINSLEDQSIGSIQREISQIKERSSQKMIGPKKKKTLINISIEDGIITTKSNGLKYVSEEIKGKIRESLGKIL